MGEWFQCLVFRSVLGLAKGKLWGQQNVPILLLISVCPDVCVLVTSQLTTMGHVFQDHSVQRQHVSYLLMYSGVCGENGGILVILAACMSK